MKASLRRFRNFVLLTSFALLATACASSHVMLGEARPAISPDQVKLYLRAPAKYSEIALLDASSRGSFAVSQQGKTNKAIERLKEEAAELGANGILLTGAGDQYGGTVATATATGSYNYATGTGVGVPVMHRSASGIAIFVEQE